MKKVILLISALFLFLSLFFLRHYFSVFYFQNGINRIALNIETNKNIGEVFVCFDNDCDLMKFENKIYSYKLNQENPLFYSEISNIELVFESREKTNEIKNISLFNQNEFNYFKNDSLNKKEIEFMGETKYSINIPFESNSKTLIQKIGVYFESLFYNWYFYLISYILIVFYFIKYKPEFNLKTKFILPLIVFLGAFLRFSHIDFIPLWNDELYTLTVISDMGEGFNFKNVFYDPGNPPLFFILSNIWLRFFSDSVFLIRLLPCIIGVFGVYVIYYATKEVFNKKIALTASFLTAINIFIITESNEIRSYILSMSLVLLGGLCLYRFYQNKSNKNLLCYLFISILLVNVHFYCLLFVLFNFILGMIIFKDSKIKFLITNFIAFFSFLIYFLISFKNSLSPTFNTWLSVPDIDVLYNHVIFYFGNIVFFVIVIFFLIFMLNKISKKEKTIILYLISAIVFVFVVAYVFSWSVKPVLFERYFCIFLPFMIIITSVFLNFDYKTNLKPLILAVIFLASINIPKYENFNLFSNIYFMVKYSTVDSLSYDDSYDIYFVIPDNKKYTNYFKNDFKITKNPKIIVSNNGIKENIDMINDYVKSSKKQKVIFYLPEICTNQIIKKEYKAVKIDTSILPVYKIFVLK